MGPAKAKIDMPFVFRMNSGAHFTHDQSITVNSFIHMYIEFGVLSLMLPYAFY